MNNSVAWPRFVALISAGVIGTAIFVARRTPASASVARSVVSVGQPLSSDGVSALRAIGDSARNPDLRWPDFAVYKTEFTRFYATNNYSLRWIQDGHVTPQGLSVIEILKNANAKGLDPEDYDGSRWTSRLAKISQNPSEQDLISFDTALTVSTMRYIRAVHCGRVNPKAFNFQLEMSDHVLNLSDFLQTNVLNASDPAGEIQKLEPQYPGYKKLLALLPVYEGYAEKVGDEKLPPTKKTVLPGQRYAGAARLGRFLQLIGDIPADTRLDPDATMYDGALVDGLKHYQGRHGENPTGRLDTRTIDELNTPAPVRIRQIRLTLERWRWMPHSFSEPPVVVNLPEYRLRVYNPDGTVAFYKNVIIGKAYGHKSPVFQKEIQYVIFRPYWDVPFSIQRGEIVPHIQKDPDYIVEHNFQVVTPKGVVVTEGQVSPETLEGIKSGQLMVRQKPGPTNSLGLVKIIFPNPDNVYLHVQMFPDCSRRTLAISATAAFASKSRRTSLPGSFATIPVGMCDG